MPGNRRGLQGLGGFGLWQRAKRAQKPKWVFSGKRIRLQQQGSLKQWGARRKWSSIYDWINKLVLGLATNLVIHIWPPCKTASIKLEFLKSLYLFSLCIAIKSRGDRDQEKTLQFMLIFTGVCPGRLSGQNPCFLRHFFSTIWSGCWLGLAKVNAIHGIWAWPLEERIGALRLPFSRTKSHLRH